jgi:hypothetical protein
VNRRQIDKREQRLREWNRDLRFREEALKERENRVIEKIHAYWFLDELERELPEEQRLVAEQQRILARLVDIDARLERLK